MLCGMTGVLYTWDSEQREKQKILVRVLLFFQKSRYVMRVEKIKIVDYFTKYIEQNLCEKEDMGLKRVLEKINNRLLSNTYPNGQRVWEEVFEEEKQTLHFDKELLQIVVQAGNGFFGRSREENVSFLDKCIEELEQQQIILRKKYIQERKVWVPVGMLGTIMVIILCV